MKKSSPRSPDRSSVAVERERIVEAGFLAGAIHATQFPPPTLTEVAFAGRSNVGKSSLMNLLTGRKSLVRTSSTPGCTRQVSWFRVRTADGAQLDLVDLPGYGYAKRSKTERKSWGQLIESYLLQRPTLRGVIVLLDIRRGLESDDMALVELLASEPAVSRPPLQIVVAATKLDKLSRAAQKPALRSLEKELNHTVIGCSVPQALGHTQLLRHMRWMTGLDTEQAPSDGF